MNMQELVAAVIARIPRYIGMKLHPDMAARLAIMDVILPLFGETAPKILSGYRSPSRQKCLKKAFDQGQPVSCGSEGTVSPPRYAPSPNSLHTLGLAVDLVVPPSSLYRTIWTAMVYGQWGGPKDPNHIEVDNPLIPKPKLWT